METIGVAPVPPSDELIVRAAWCRGNRVHIENKQVITVLFLLIAVGVELIVVDGIYTLAVVDELAGTGLSLEFWSQ